jgi:hypothetical protein
MAAGYEKFSELLKSLAHPARLKNQNMLQGNRHASEKDYRNN